MADKTGIEWTDATWNPTTGCDRVSPGCDHCYALTLAKRLKAMGSPAYQLDGDPETSGPGFRLTMHPDRLDQPLRWTRPRRIFVNSMSDLFHQDVTDEFLVKVFDTMANSYRHTFQVLTKRHARMRSFTRRYYAGEFATLPLDEAPLADAPIPNVWLGVSVEDQKWADIRVPALLDTPAAVRFLSCEPLLGPVDLDHWLLDCRHDAKHVGQWKSHGKCEPSGAASDLGWVIVGGESGRDARPMHPGWARALRDQCTAAGVPFLFKQWGQWRPLVDGEDPTDSAWRTGEGVHAPIPWRPDTAGAEPGRHDRYGDVLMRLTSKHDAGRELDGRTWDEYPTAVSV